MSLIHDDGVWYGMDRNEYISIIYVCVLVCAHDLAVFHVYVYVKMCALLYMFMYTSH